MRNYQNLKRILCTFLFVSLHALVFAQTGSIQGMVLDESTKMGIGSASIVLKGTKIGTATGANGAYTLKNINTTLPLILVVSYTGYDKKEIPVTLQSGENKILNIEIAETEGGQKLEGVVVQGAKNKESESVLNMERKNATIAVQKIGSVELTRKGVSNVSDGVAKISGVTMNANHHIFIRGLGDRYNNVTLNGLPVPSTNPDQKIIPLEIFPTSLVQNIAVVKSYTSPYYGDVSGGTIDITTKEYPTEPFVKIGISTGVNSITTGRSFLSNANQNFLYKLGYGTQQRKSPAIVDNPRFDSRTNGNPGYSNLWSPMSTTAPLNYGANISAGKLYKFNAERQLGYIFSLSQKQEFSYRNGSTGLFNAQEIPFYSFTTQNYIQSSNTSALLNLYYKANDRFNISLTSLYVNDANTDIYNGRGRDYDLGNVFYTRNTFTQNMLITNQLKAKYTIDNYTRLNAAFGYSKTKGNMPDRTQNGFYDNNNSYTLLFQSPADNQRYSYLLDDNELVGSLSFEKDNKNESSVFKKIQAGINGRYKFRTFHANVITANLRQLKDYNVDINNVDAFLTQYPLGDGNGNTWYYSNSFNASNDYDANLGIIAPYANFVFNWNKKWNLVAGLRVEASNQKTYYHLSNDPSDALFRLSEIPQVNFLPGVTLKRTLTEKSNMLFAVSRSMSRPLFVEAAPFRLNNAAATAETEGNPNIKNSSIINVDLKYEIYPSSAELFAISLFGKHITNPIERMQLASSDPLFSFVNTDNAIIAGAELEFNRNMGKLFDSESNVLKNTNFGFNATYMYNRIQFNAQEISANSGKPVAPTNNNRPLFGASPYLINFDMSYKNEWSKNSSSLFTVTYNVFGKRLFVAGAQGAGDVYEMPVNTLNFIMNNTFAKKYEVNLSILNILNPSVKYLQEFNTNRLEYNNYKKGVEVSLSLGYKF